MRVVTIADSDDRGCLAFDLVDILRLLEAELASTSWSVTAVEAVGAGAEELHRLDDARERIPGRRLLSWAARVGQVIEGDFSGYVSGRNSPWVTVRAIDSSAHDVVTADDSVIERVRARFGSVREISADEYFGRDNRD